MGQQRTDEGGAPPEESLLRDNRADSEPPPALSEPPAGEASGSAPAPTPAVDGERVELAPAKRVNVWTRYGEWLDANQDELWTVCSLLVLGVVVRVLWLNEIETWGDAAIKWHFVRQLLHEHDFGPGVSWDHHMARFGVNIPVLLVQAVFGSSVRTYYIVPVAAHVLTGLMTYVIARRLSGRAAGVCCALLWIFFRGMDRSASQLLPDGLAGFPLLLAAYCLVRLQEGPRYPLRWLIGSTLSFIWVCSIKESNLILLPGVSLALWLTRRRWSDVLIFGGGVALAAALDTAYFALTTDYSSRLAIVQEAHGELSVGFWELFDRILKLEPAWQMLFWLWVPSVLWLAGSKDKRTLSLWIVPLSFVLLITFMVRRVDPIVLWVSFKSRYFAAVAPFWVLAIGMFAVDVARRAWSAHARPGWSVVPQHFARRGSEWAVAVCVTLALSTYLSERGSLSVHPLVTERRKAVILNDAYRRNLPIIERATNPRGLRTLYSIHVKDEYLVQARVAKGGQLPGLHDALHMASRKDPFSYLLRDKTAYTRPQLERAVESGCAIEVRTRGRVILERHTKLPDRCTAPRGEVLPR